jgi:hypothetical protein
MTYLSHFSTTKSSNKGRQRPKQVRGSSGSPCSQYGCTIHLHQVRYSIRKHVYKSGSWEGCCLYYIYDERNKHVPSWAPDFFTQRNYAIGHLQDFLGWVIENHYQYWLQLRDQYEKSEITFTKRSKKELAWRQ